MRQYLARVLYECVSQEKPEVLATHVALEQVGYICKLQYLKRVIIMFPVCTVCAYCSLFRMNVV